MPATTRPGDGPIPGDLTVAWRPEVDGDLRIGLLALQSGLIGPVDLVAALRRWSLHGEGSLDRILVESGAMTEEDRATVAAQADRRAVGHATGAGPTLAGMGSMATLPDPTEARPGAEPAGGTGSLNGPDSEPGAVAAEETGVDLVGSRFQVVRPFARGGLGVVSVAIDAELRREVALKEIRPELADDPASRARFLREAEITGRLEHPGVVPIYGLGMDGRGRPFYAMRLVDGESLEEALVRYHRSRGAGTSGGGSDRALELRRLLGRFVAVCGVVAYAHSRGVIHRDLKPANVLLGPYGETMVVDWGLARPFGEAPAGENVGGPSPIDDPEAPTTIAGAVVGSPAYMSPEQAEGAPGAAGPAADVYSLGATLHHLVVGAPPFRGSDVFSVLRRVRRGEWSAPRSVDSTIPRELDAICRRAMATRPGDRYASALELAGDVERWLADEPLPWLVESWGKRVSRWERRNRLLIRAAGASLTVVAAVAMVAAVLIGGSREQERSHRREAEFQRERAEEQRRRAEDRNVELQRLSARIVLDDGLTRCESGDIARGMLQLGRALTLAAPGDPGLERLARDCLAGWSERLIALRARLTTGGKVRAAFSTDGRRIVTASDDRTARVWDADTGHPMTPPLPHDDEVNHAAFSPDGARIVTASNDRRARIWDVATGRLAAPLLAHRGPVNWVAFDPAGRRVATASDDFTAMVWDAATGRPLTRPLRHSLEVYRVAFSPDGKWVATASQDGTARIWDADTGRPATPPLRHGRRVSSVAFSPDGARVVTASVDGTARVWDAATGDPVGSAMVHRARVNSVVFSPDGKKVATASDDFTAMVWDASTGRALVPPLRHRGVVISAAFSGDGALVATTSQDRTARVWDADTGRLCGSPMLHRGWVYSAEFAPDGRSILTADRDGVARLWDLPTRRSAGPILSHPGRVQAAAFSPDGARVATACADGAVRFWDPVDGRPVGPTIRLPRGARWVAFRPDGRRIVTASIDGTARVWDALTGQPAGPTISHRGQVNSAVFSPDGAAILTASQGGTARVWDADTGRQIGPTLAHPRWVWTAEFDRDGRRILTSCGDGKARIWDARSHRLAVGPMVADAEVWWAAFSPDGTRVLTAGQGDAVRLWNAADGAPLGTIAEHQGPVHTARFSPDGDRILTASDDGTAQLWDAEGHRPLMPPMEHGEAVRWAAFSADGRRIVTASGDRTARVWNRPRPLEVEVDRVADWLASLTGLALDDRGGVLVLDSPAWQAAHDRLGEARATGSR